MIKCWLPKTRTKKKIKWFMRFRRYPRLGGDWPPRIFYSDPNSWHRMYESGQEIMRFWDDGVVDERFIYVPPERVTKSYDEAYEMWQQYLKEQDEMQEQETSSSE